MKSSLSFPPSSPHPGYYYHTVLRPVTHCYSLTIAVPCLAVLVPKLSPDPGHLKCDWSQLQKQETQHTNSTVRTCPSVFLQLPCNALFLRLSLFGGSVFASVTFTSPLLLLCWLRTGRSEVAAALRDLWIWCVQGIPGKVTITKKDHVI